MLSYYDFPHSFTVKPRNFGIHANSHFSLKKIGNSFADGMISKRIGFEKCMQTDRISWKFKMFFVFNRLTLFTYTIE